MSDQQETPAVKPPKGRSPSYPGISLKTAVDRARKIYDEFKQHPVPLATATARWGYKKPTTGPASVTYAALKKWGLITDTGHGTQRVARISDLAVKILNPNPGQEAALQTAALTPPIMKEWWERYQADVAPPETLQWEYVIQGPFTESGLSDFVRVYKESIAYAKLSSTGIVVREEPEPEGDGGDGDDELHDQDDSRHQRLHERLRKPRGKVSDTQTFAVPVAVGVEPVVIEGQFPMSEAEWDQFLAVLSAMKPGLVGERKEATDFGDGYPPDPEG